MKAHIIGAGPAGNHLAKLLAKDYEVTVYEQGSIGKPVQCTGILTKSIEDIMPMRKEFLMNRFKSVRLHAGNEEVKIKNDDYLVCRTRFDNHLAKRAKDEGARYLLGKSFLGMADDKIEIKDVKNNKIQKIKLSKKDILVGADGPRSKVSQLIGNKPLQCWFGAQAVVNKEVDKTEYQVYFGDVCPGFFAWDVPESATKTRIGLAASKESGVLFKRFIKKNNIEEMQGGLIPRYNPKIITQRGSIFIVGDAAGQVKATTGGGIVPGMKAAGCLAEALLEGKDYESIWRNKVGKRLDMHLIIRNTLDKFQEKDYEELLRSVNNEKMKKILFETDRDKSGLKILMKIIMADPRLLKFARFLI